MKRLRSLGRPKVVLLSVSLITATLFGAATSHAEVEPYDLVAPVSRYAVSGSVAEIIAASPDGNTLVFTNAGEQTIGFVDIRDPRLVEPLGTIAVEGEPTSVAITPNGRYAIAAVLDVIDEETESIADQQPGMLVFIDLETREIASQLPLPGIGPDSLAITPDGSKAIVAIEDEEDTDNLPGQRPGSINVVTIDYENPAESTVTSVAIDLSDVEDANYPTDPQPEFVALSPDGETAAISLQENNAIALLDIETEQIIRIFSAGTVSQTADLITDSTVSLTQPYVGRREPDGIAFTPDGQYLVIANEGDTEDSDGIGSGGRGWSILDLDGNVVFDSGSSLEEFAAAQGLYPDDRSEDRGIEIEGVAVGTISRQTIAAVASERGNFVAVYDIGNLEEPRLLGFLPTGDSPEGVILLPSRNLLLTANEGDGSIDFFQMNW